MGTVILGGVGLNLLYGKGGADSAVTVTGVATADELISVNRITVNTNGVIGSVSDVTSSSSISAANTVTVSGATIDSNQLLSVLFNDISEGQ